MAKDTHSFGDPFENIDGKWKRAPDVIVHPNSEDAAEAYTLPPSALSKHLKTFRSEDKESEKKTVARTVWHWAALLFLIGGAAFGFLVPILSGYIAYAIADRPGLVPGVVGGAVAVTIQGQRLISTTGIKCSGNQVTLNGLPYSPPYVIVGIGDPDRMQAELTVDPMLALYRDYTTIEGGGVFWDMTELETAVAPAYDGLLDLTYATQMPS